MLIEPFRDKEQFLLVKSPVFSTWKITSACDAQVCIYIYIFHSSSFILYFPVKSLEVRNFSCKLCFYSLHCMDLMFFFYFFIINE